MTIGGYYDTFTKQIVLNNLYLNSEGSRNILLHEIQHRIQKIEGIENGSSVKNAIRYYTNLGEIMSKEVENRSRMNLNEIKSNIPEISKSNPIHPDIKRINVDTNSRYSKYMLKNKQVAKLYNEIYNNGIEGEYNRAKFAKKNIFKNILSQGIFSSDERRRMDINNESENVQKQETQELDNSSFSFVKNDYRGSHQIENAKSIAELDINYIQNKVIDANGGLSKQDYTDLGKLKKILKNPNENVKIYRAAPVNELNNGDWVTTDKTYAKNVANENGGKVYEYEVKANQLYYSDNVKELPSLHRLSSFQFVNNDTKYSQNNNDWYDYLDKNFKSEIFINHYTKTFLALFHNKKTIINLLIIVHLINYYLLA